MSASVYQKVEAVFPGFHCRVFSRDLQDMQLYQLENGVRGAGASHCQSIFQQDGGMRVSATQPARAHCLLSLCPLPAHARGRRALARACVRELSAAMAPGRSSPPPSQSRVRCGVPRRRNGSPPACRLPKTHQRLGNREPWEHLPAHLPVGRPQTNRYLRTTLKRTNQTFVGPEPQ